MRRSVIGENDHRDGRPAEIVSFSVTGDLSDGAPIAHTACLGEGERRFEPFAAASGQPGPEAGMRGPTSE